jgi:uncharacterized protein YndB with AHSA1/START domain
MTMTAEVTMHVDAPAARVYALVSDVTRMGEWSPDCVRCESQGGASRPAVGARFRGSNRQGWIRWTTTAEVVSAEPAREFAFTTKSGSHDATRWRYVFSPADGGTDVTESFEEVYTPAYVRVAEKLFMRNREQQLTDGMRTTLERVKAAAEQGADRDGRPMCDVGHVAVAPVTGGLPDRYRFTAFAPRVARRAVNFATAGRAHVDGPW